MLKVTVLKKEYDRWEGTLMLKVIVLKKEYDRWEGTLP